MQALTERSVQLLAQAPLAHRQRGSDEQDASELYRYAHMVAQLPEEISQYAFAVQVDVGYVVQDSRHSELYHTQPLSCIQVSNVLYLPLHVVRQVSLTIWQKPEF